MRNRIVLRDLARRGMFTYKVYTAPSREIALDFLRSITGARKGVRNEWHFPKF